MRPKRTRHLIPFIVISLLLHLVLIAAYLAFTAINKKTEVAEKPDFIEITELPVPKEKETEPPKEKKRLAERSHKAEKETTRDDFTKKGAVAQLPRPPVVPKPVSRPKQEQKTQPQKESIKEAKQKPVEQPRKIPDISDRKIASLPKRLPKAAPTPAPKKQTGKEKKSLTREDLFSMPPTTPLRPNRPSDDLLGDRRIPTIEDTVDFDTTEFRYFAYFMKMKRQIERIWTYPKQSRIRGEQGELRLVFTIRSDGALEGIELLDSSLHVRLDDEAMRAIQVAAPYNPFPESWAGLERLNIRAVFVYKMGGWHFRR